MFRTTLFRIALAGSALILAANATAAEISTAGELVAPAGSALMVVSTDEVIQRALGSALQMSPRAATAAALTLTVTCAERQLGPDVSPRILSAGDPQVTRLLDATGVAQLHDRGLAGFAADYAAAELGPSASATPNFGGLGHLAEDLGLQGTFGAPKPSSSATPESEATPAPSDYDRVIIARVTAGDMPGELAAVAVLGPGDDEREVKEQMAQRIADVLTMPHDAR